MDAANQVQGSRELSPRHQGFITDAAGGSVTRPAGVITGASGAHDKGGRGVYQKGNWGSSLRHQGVMRQWVMHGPARAHTNSCKGQQRGRGDRLGGSGEGRGKEGEERGKGGGYLGRGRTPSHPAVSHLNSVSSKSCCEGIVACHYACSFVLQVILLTSCCMAPATRLVSWHNALLVLLPCNDNSKDQTDSNSDEEECQQTCVCN